MAKKKNGKKATAVPKQETKELYPDTVIPPGFKFKLHMGHHRALEASGFCIAKLSDHTTPIFVELEAKKIEFRAYYSETGQEYTLLARGYQIDAKYGRYIDFLLEKVS